MAVAARWRELARAEPRGLFAQASGWTAAARPERRGGDVHLRDADSPALHVLLRARPRAATGVSCAPRPTSSVVRMPCIRPLRVGVGRARMIRRYWPFELTRR